MSFTLVQANQRSSGAVPTASFTVAFTSNNTAKNYLSACLRFPAGSGNTFLVTDSQNNNWQQALSFVVGPDSFQIWFVSQCAAGANTITIAEQGGGTFNVRAVIGELTGFTRPVAVDQTSSGTTATILPDISSGFIMPTRPIELLIGMFANYTSDTVSPSSSADWTLIDTSDGNLAAFFKSLPATPPTSWTASMVAANSQQYCASITALSAAGTASPTLVRQYADSTSASGTVLTAPVTLTAGDVGMATMLWADNTHTISSFVDSLGNVWNPVPNTLQTNAVLFGTGGSLQHWYSVITVGGSSTLTITWSGSTTSLTFAGAEFNNINTTTPIQTSTGQSGNAVPASPSISPTGNIVLYANLLTGDGLEKTPAPPWIILSNGQGNDDYWGPMYQIVVAGKYDFVGAMNTYVNAGAGIAGFRNMGGPMTAGFGSGSGGSGTNFDKRPYIRTFPITNNIDV